MKRWAAGNRAEHWAAWDPFNLELLWVCAALTAPTGKLWPGRGSYQSHGPSAVQKMQIRLPFLPSPSESQNQTVAFTISKRIHFLIRTH